MELSIALGLKEAGGHGLAPWGELAVTKGQHCKVGIAVRDESGKPVTMSLFTLKLRVPQSDGGVLVKTAAAVDDVKGESEVALSSADTELLGVGTGKNLEVEIFLTGTPTTTSFHPIRGVLTVVDQLLRPAP